MLSEVGQVWPWKPDLPGQEGGCDRSRGDVDAADPREARLRWEGEGDEPGQGRGLSRWGGRLLVHGQLRTGAQEGLAGEQREERKAGKSS